MTEDTRRDDYVAMAGAILLAPRTDPQVIALARELASIAAEVESRVVERIMKALREYEARVDERVARTDNYSDREAARAVEHCIALVEKAQEHALTFETVAAVEARVRADARPRWISVDAEGMPDDGATVIVTTPRGIRFARFRGSVNAWESVPGCWRLTVTHWMALPAEPSSAMVASRKVISKPGAALEVTELELTPEGKAALTTTAASLPSASTATACATAIRKPASTEAPPDAACDHRREGARWIDRASVTVVDLTGEAHPIFGTPLGRTMRGTMSLVSSETWTPVACPCGYSVGVDPTSPSGGGE